MRPKTVLILFVAGIGLLAAFMFVKGFAGKDVSGSQEALATNSVPTTTTTTAQGTTEPPKTGVIAMTPQQETQARVEKAMDEIREDLANNQPLNLLGKLNSQDREVRLEAVDAIKALDYTNGVPQLIAAMNAASDIKEKAAIQEAIDFLQLPVGNPEEELKAIQAMQKAELKKPEPKGVPTNYHGLPGMTRPPNPVKRQPAAPSGTPQ
jgi:hypothetical protein